MWELNISIGSDKADALKGIESRIKPYVAPGGGVMIFDRSESRAYLTIACEEQGKTALIEELKEAVSDIITVQFKQHYINRHSRLPKANKINYNAFLRALVAFDREWDRELIFKNLHFKNEFLLDGFFNFRLKELKTKWQEVCDLASSNSGYLEYHDTFTELLTFLVKTIDSKVQKVYVKKEGGEYLLYGEESKPLDRIKLSLDKTINDETLLPNLINIAPKEVVLCGPGIPEYVKNLIACIFKILT